MVMDLVVGEITVTVPWDRIGSGVVDKTSIIVCPVELMGVVECVTFVGNPPIAVFTTTETGPVTALAFTTTRNL
jgi:hypothetical protein